MPTLTKEPQVSSLTMIDTAVTAVALDDVCCLSINLDFVRAMATKMRSDTFTKAATAGNHKNIEEKYTTVDGKEQNEAKQLCNSTIDW